MTIYHLGILLSQFGTSPLFQSSSNCCSLTCIQVSQEAGKVVWYSHLLKNFPLFAVVHTVKGFGTVNKAEIDVFLELSCFFYDRTDVGNLTSASSSFSKSSLNIWKFLVHVLLKPAKSLQLCPTLCEPIDSSPPGSAVPGMLQARVLEWVAIAFSNAWRWKKKVKSLSCVQLLATPWTPAYQAPPSMGFSRQEYWSGVPLPSQMLKPGLENFEHYFTSVWDECICAVVWAFFSTACLWDWNENWPFPVVWPLPSFPNLLAYWVQHFISILF